MYHPFKTRGLWQVFKIVGIYAAFSSLWIYLSDSALEFFVRSPATIASISIFKGFAFVLVTAALLFHLIARYVTGTMEAKQRGRTSEERFQTIYNNMYDAVFINDAGTGGFIDANQTACTMFGYSRSEFLAMTFGHMSLGTPPYSAEEAQELLQRALTGSSQVFEWVSKKKDGSVFPSEITLCKTTLDDNGCILAMVRDISERKRAEERLRLSEEKFSTAFRISPDSISINRLEDGIYLEVNEGFSAITGYQPEEVIGRSSLELNIWVNPEDRACLVREINAHGIAMNHEAEFRRKDGTIVVGQMSARRIDIEGAPCILNIARDITERKRAEEMLRESEQTLKLLMEALPVGVGITNYHGVIEYVNSSFVSHFGYTIDDIPTTDQWFLKAYPEPGYRKQVAAAWTNGLSEMADGTQVVPREAKITCKNGTVRHVIINTQLIRNRALAIFTDITEREFTHNELLKVQKLESLGLLAGGIAHDFNNILTSILGNISFAQLFIDGAHKAREPLEQAEKAAQRAAELAGQLLTFAKGGEPVKKPLSVQRLVEESVSLVLRGTEVTAALDLPADLRIIEADAGQINQAFNNIVINAVQAMPGGGRLAITAENVTLDDSNTLGVAAGEYVKLTFSDEGCGIPNEIQKQIFDPYFTTKAGGTGLGLSSVYSIITRHGGHISVSSGAGTGATFTIHLPAAGAATPAAGRPEDGAVASAPPASGSVLVMDDDEMILDLATKMLHLLGYRVTTCTTGEEAVSRYRAAQESGTPFDVVIMDLTVPGGMGGKETARVILELDPAARLVVSSGYSSDPIMAHYQEYGFCGAVIKPYRMKELAEALGGAVRQGDGL
ncbi:PAS domain S-box protein [Geobacter sp. FeAm09]|uniref:PAS domain-containing hybrid sensor histidine kinase/response regulator n=1 Tax=Geobacter sp. FeAm09 TaxID=2597769 RepID=UPI0011EE6326|nr:PAS domain-containing sensor histidine kinase [Geobacter sp. FeAm09]QEM68195.1 PAS domain S-box protein [Geobacter sp. FeAm09]